MACLRTCTGRRPPSLPYPAQDLGATLVYPAHPSPIRASQRATSVPETAEGKRGRTGPGPNSADRVAGNAASSSSGLPLPPAFPDFRDSSWTSLAWMDGPDAPEMDDSWLDEPCTDEPQGTSQDAAFNEPLPSQAAPVQDSGQAAHVGQSAVKTENKKSSKQRFCVPVGNPYLGNKSGNSMEWQS